jgi:membrane-associated protease RseP (regulator of RpoE activity)
MRLGSSAAFPGILLLAIVLLAAPPQAFAGDSCGGKSESAYLGIGMQRIEGGLAEALDVEADSGVLVRQVLDESPAKEAGLEAGDIIVELAGKEAGTPEKLRKILERHAPGDKVEVRYVRDGKRQSAEVTLGEGRQISKKLQRKLGKLREDALVRERGYLGVHTQSLSGDLGEYFGVEDGEGALVTEVVEDSPAAKLGLKAGDVIVEVGDERIEDPSDLRRAVRGYTEATEVGVVWIRNGKRQSGKVAIELRETPFSALGHAFWGDQGFLPHLRMFDFDMGDVEIESDDEWADEPGAELERPGRPRMRRLVIRDDLEDAVEQLSDEISELREELQTIKDDLATD